LSAESQAPQDPFWLGKTLVEAGAITEEQFSSAKRLWRKTPRESFAAVLIDLGLGDPQRLASMVARHHNLPEAGLDPRRFDGAAVRLVPAETARRRLAVPFRLSGRVLDVAAAEPANYPPHQAARDFAGYETRLHVAPRGDILGLIREGWRDAATADAGAHELFDNLLREAVAERATDLHLEPRDNSLDIRLRIDGRLVHKCFFEQASRESIVQAAKIAGHMDISERRLPQDGQGTLDIGARRYRLRFSSLPAVNGESVVVRIMDQQTGLRTFDEMGLFPADAAHLRELMALPGGLVYVTGPTGCGKTTLLHSMLNNLPSPEINELKIVTIEEPVEIRNPRFFLQVGVDERIGRSFDELLRHVLRHDPDVVLVGETRDRPTAEVTLKAALTGHLCLSTLHSADALGAVARLSDIGLDPLMLSCALKGIISQRLVRLPCPRCRAPHPRNGALLARFRSCLEAGGVDPAGAAFVAPGSDRSCPGCGGRGYCGRTAIIEVFPLGGLETLVAERAPHSAFLGILRGRGCRTLLEDGVRKAALGLTTIEEVHAAVGDQPPDGLLSSTAT
jgi:type II secretory ATPase GspE/PulE/Tfp pilus assembly ATPase PilB-like protein